MIQIPAHQMMAALYVMQQYKEHQNREHEEERNYHNKNNFYMKKTHKVLDLADNEFGGDTDGVFVGTLEDCNKFVEEQTTNSVNTYSVVPMTKKEVDEYPDNN